MKAAVCTSFIFLILQIPFYEASGQKKEVKVSCAGEMRNVMHQNNLAAHARLDTLLRRPNIVALGPEAGLTGEITVLNSTPYVTRMKGRVPETTNDSTAQAAFLVYAEVAEWEEHVIPSFVKDFPTLENFIAQRAKAQRYNDKEPIPFRIKGKIASAQVHVVNKTDGAPHSHADHDKIKVYFEPANTDVEMVGFYSTRHQGIFTHHDSFVHIHLVTSDKLLSGHVDNIKFLPAKATLYIPKWPESQKRREFKLKNPGKNYREPRY